jgi:amidase
VSEAAGREPGRLRIALSLKPPFTALPARLDPVVRARVVALAERLAELGHTVEEAEPRYGQIGLTFIPRATAGIAERVRDLPHPHLLDRRTLGAARLGRLLGGAPLRVARRAEATLHRRIGALFDTYDVLLAPTTAAPPPRIGSMADLSGLGTDRAMIAACPYAWPWNILGWPGVNVPAGFVDGGLPVGAQLLGPANSEPLLVSLAAQLEADQRWHEHWPPHGAPADSPAV